MADAELPDDIPLDQAPEIIKKIQDGSLHPKSITDQQRRICVRFLLHVKDYEQNDVAGLLKISPSTVTRDKKKLVQEDAWILSEMDDRTLAVQMIQTADKAAARLFRKGREREAWTVLRECVELLQSLGHVKKQATEIKGDFSFVSFLNEIASRKRNGYADKDGNGHSTGSESIPARVFPGVGDASN